jgi:tRNA threonylcarbamoyladenosine modification (KEOPS) complex  Pcc1 subunit
MNSIDIKIEIPDLKLRSTLYHTLLVEMEATKNERGYAEIGIIENKVCIKIIAVDYVAARALTNSILRLAKASLDVAGSITINK